MSADPRYGGQQTTATRAPAMSEAIEREQLPYMVDTIFTSNAAAEDER